MLWPTPCAAARGAGWEPGRCSAMQLLSPLACVLAPETSCGHVNIAIMNENDLPRLFLHCSCLLCMFATGFKPWPGPAGTHTPEAHRTALLPSPAAAPASVFWGILANIPLK